MRRIEFTKQVLRVTTIVHFVKAWNIRISLLSSSASWLVPTKIGSSM